MKIIQDNRGFTLVELLITTLISALIGISVMVGYTVHQRVQTSQSQLVEMQQNLRAGSAMLSRDLRMAGFDPGGSAGAGFEWASNDAVAFSQDNNSDGDVNDAGEHIAYDIYTGPNGQLNLGRAVSNAPIVMLGVGHVEATGHTPVAENIEAIEFNYVLESGATTTAPTNAQRGEIRSIQVSILARTTFADPQFDNNNPVFTPTSGNSFALGAPPPAGNFRRKLTIETIKCRNIGL